MMTNLHMTYVSSFLFHLNCWTDDQCNFYYFSYINPGTRSKINVYYRRFPEVCCVVLPASANQPPNKKTTKSSTMYVFFSHTCVMCKLVIIQISHAFAQSKWLICTVRCLGSVNLCILWFFKYICIDTIFASHILSPKNRSLFRWLYTYLWYLVLSYT